MTRALRSQLCSLAALVGAGVLLLAGSALALQTFSGAICQPLATGLPIFGPLPKLLTSFNGVTNQDSSATASLSCPTPASASSLTSVGWNVSVTDTSVGKAVNCVGMVVDTSGNILASSPSQATGNAFTGTAILPLSTTSVAFSSSQSLVVVCDVPAGSAVHSLSVP